MDPSSGPGPRTEPSSSSAPVEADAALLADVRARDPRSLDRVVTRYGRSLAGVAYVILQNRDQAQGVVARAVADVWTALPGTAPDRPAELETRLLGATARRAREANTAAHEVDAFATTRSVLARLSPDARAAAALHLLGDLSPARVAAEMGIDAARARTLLAEATAATGSPAALRDAVARLLEGLPVTVTGDTVREAQAHAAAGRRRRVFSLFRRGD